MFQVLTQKLDYYSENNRVSLKQQIVVNDGIYHTFGLNEIGLKVTPPSVLMLGFELMDRKGHSLSHHGSVENDITRRSFDDNNKLTVGPSLKLKKERSQVHHRYLSNELNELVDTVVMGHSCSWDDIIDEHRHLPLLETGDWLIFTNMGTYTTVLETFFNGLPLSEIVRCRILQ